jgi:hypothetical protein
LAQKEDSFAAYRLKFSVICLLRTSFARLG